jgi:hypothetical protein
MALDNLNKREKILAVLTVPLVLIAGWILFSTWWGPLNTLRTERDDLTTEVEKDARRVKVARKAQDRLGQWHRRSLPSDLEIAASEYHGWLFRLANEAGFEKPDVNVTTSMADRRRRQAGAFRTLRFTVRATAKLEELTEFLFRFDSADRLHRIRNATVNPTQGSDKLDLSFVVEALSLPDAETVSVDVAEGSFEAAARVTPDLQREMVYTGKDGKLADAAKVRLAGFRGFSDFDFLKGKSLEEVKAEINEKTRATGVAASIDGDKLYLRCEEVDSEDPSGRLASSDPGEYRRAIVQRNVFAEYKAPPPVRTPGPEPPPPPKFDPYKFAYVSAIVRGFDGEPEAWVIARTSGEKFQLREGDTFEVGDVQAKMIHVNRRDAEMEFDGKRWLVPLGDNLREAKPLFDESEEDEESQQEEPAQEQPEQDEAEKEESAQEQPEQDEAEKEESTQEQPEQDEAEKEESAQERPEQKESMQEEAAQEESEQQQPTQEEAKQVEADPQGADQEQPEQDEADQEEPPSGQQETDDQDAGE